MCVFYAEPRISRVAISSGRARYITQPILWLFCHICRTHFPNFWNDPPKSSLMSQPPFRYSNIESNKLLPGIKLVEFLSGPRRSSRCQGFLNGENEAVWSLENKEQETKRRNRRSSCLENSSSTASRPTTLRWISMKKMMRMRTTKTFYNFQLSPRHAFVLLTNLSILKHKMICGGGWLHIRHAPLRWRRRRSK